MDKEDAKAAELTERAQASQGAPLPAPAVAPQPPAQASSQPAAAPDTPRIAEIPPVQDIAERRRPAEDEQGGAPDSKRARILSLHQRLVGGLEVCAEVTNAVLVNAEKDFEDVAGSIGAVLFCFKGNLHDAVVGGNRHWHRLAAPTCV
jgi:hypothetical protein